MTANKKRLETHHYEAIRLLLEGLTPDKVAQHLGKGRRTIYDWLQREDFKTELEFYRRQIFEAAIANCINKTNDAINNLDTISKDPEVSPSVRVNASSKLLDVALRNRDKDLELQLEQVQLQLNGHSNED
jgi:IS30 family transposase